MNRFADTGVAETQVRDRTTPASRFQRLERGQFVVEGQWAEFASSHMPVLDRQNRFEDQPTISHRDVTRKHHGETGDQPTSVFMTYVRQSKNKHLMTRRQLITLDPAEDDGATIKMRLKRLARPGHPASMICSRPIRRRFPNGRTMKSGSYGDGLPASKLLSTP